MPRKHTPSFVIELPLRTKPADERACGVILRAAQNLYNAVLGEALNRLDLMRASAAFKAARAMPKGEPRSPQRKARREAFERVKKQFDFSKSAMEDFARECAAGSIWIKEHLPGHCVQTTATRAFKTVERYMLRIGGRPHFKCYRKFNSFEAKEAKSTIIWRDGSVHFAGMVIAAILDPADAWQAEALKAATKYCRIMRREIHGTVRWSVQLVQQGKTPMRRETRPGIVGLDIGPGTIAVVGVEQGEAFLEELCPNIRHPWNALRRVERAMDRSRRATNPECFDDKGRWKKGAKARNRSKRYQELAAKRSERERCLKAERRRAHGEKKNRVLGVGTTVRSEANSYKGWQRGRFGKRMKVQAPAAFMATLRNCHACRLEEFNPRPTALSQFDHIDGTYTKKPLSQRHHEFSDGSRVQRDLYSAFLSSFVEGGRLDAQRAAAAWADGGVIPLAQAGVGAFLRAASSEIKTPSGRSSWSSGQQGFGLPHVLPHMQKLRPGGRGVRSHNGVLKHREALGVASARKRESGAGCAEAPSLRTG
jgi:hypothetical protein